MKRKRIPSLIGRTPQQVREAQAAKAAKMQEKRQNPKKTTAERMLWGLLSVYVLLLVIHFAGFGVEIHDIYNSEVVNEAHILSAGDLIFHSPFLNTDTYITEDGEYNFDDIFTYIKEDYDAADYTVVNLEVTLSDQGYYSGHPLFVTPYTLASTLKEASVDMCLLANNHIYDNKEDGMTMTMDILDDNEIAFTGIRRDTSDLTYTIKKVNDINVGILNYTFELGTTDDHKGINGRTISDESAPLINSFNYEDIQPFYDEVKTTLAETDEKNVDYTIAYIHWGTEYRTYENELQQNIAQELCNLGIDILIGGHPHVIQPVDLLTSESGDHQMICAYSIGNHLSNQQREYMTDSPEGHTEDGIMIDLTLEKTRKGDVALTAIEFEPTWVHRINHSSDSRSYYIFPMDTPEEIVEQYGIQDDLEASEQRTNEIIGEGVQKVQDALPLIRK